MKIVDRIPADPRLSWNRRGALVLTAMLERIGHEVTIARLVELTELKAADVLKQIRRFTTMRVVSRRVDLDSYPAQDYFEMPEASTVRARSLLQLADDTTLRDLLEDRGLDIDIAYGRFLERQPYPVALGKALREARADRGWSLLEAQEATPVSMATLSNYENGLTVPTLIMLAELALRYRVDAVDLIRYAACHSRPDKRVQRLKIADPTLRATLTHQFLTYDQSERARQQARRSQLARKRAS
ncbi:helix-turn-helix transcriptional regulator [Lentzea sp. NPDC003310]|uniref:helix-turn-helix domain-containing protein n=1 Tax=Lentzea sp. NPDC003310 TaxID=3154447 RepID=UPI0033BA093A